MSSTRDVYAGDANFGGKSDLRQENDYGFEFVADADPDILVRVASQFLLSNKLPSRFDMSGTPDGRATAIVEMRGITGATAESIRRKLEQLTCMSSVRIWNI